MLLCPGVQLPQEGHDFQPHQIPAGGGRVSVGLVLYMGDAPGGGIGHQILPGGLQKGPQERRAHRRDSAEAFEARAPRQIHQNGLRIVPGMMGGENPPATLLPGGLLQKGIPHNPGGLLQGEALPGCNRPHVAPPHSEGDAMGGAPIPDEGLVPIRRPAPEAVVEMGRRHLPPEGHGFRHLDGKSQQAHGIHPPGNGAQQPVAGPGMELDEFLGLDQIIPRRHNACPGWRRRCTPASTAVPPCRFPRGGSLPLYIPQYYASPNPRRNNPPGTKTARYPRPAR